MTFAIYILAIALAALGIFSFSQGIGSSIEGNVIGSGTSVILGILMLIAGIILAGALAHKSDDSYFYRKITSLFSS